MKTKSINDINRQINRIYRGTTDKNRRERANAAYTRYRRNIEGSKTYARDYNRFVNAPNTIAASQIGKETTNRQYTRRQYMGLNKG